MFLRWQYQTLFWCPMVATAAAIAPTTAAAFCGEVPVRPRETREYCIAGIFYQAEPSVWPTPETYDDTTGLAKWYQPASEPIRSKERELRRRLESREIFWVDVKPAPLVGGSGSSTPIGGGYIYSKHFQYQSNFAPVITEAAPPELVSADRWAQPMSQPVLKPKHYEHLYRWNHPDPDFMIDPLVVVDLDKWKAQQPDWIARTRQTRTGQVVAPVEPLIAIEPPFSFIPDIEQPSPRAAALRLALYPPYYPFVTVITPPLPEVVTIDKWLGEYPDRIAKKREASPPWYPELYGQSWVIDPRHLGDAAAGGGGTEAPPIKKTRKQLRDEILYRLGDTTSTVWSVAELNSYISEGYNKLVLMSGALWVKRSYSDVAGEGTMTLDTDLYQIERATWRNKKIEPLVHRDLESRYPSYRTIQGDVFGYLMEGDGLRILRKVRVPSAAASNVLSLEFWRRPTALAADADTFELPDRWLKYIRHFVLWQALERDGLGQDLELAEHYKQRWEAGVGRLMHRRATVSRQRLSRLGSVPDGDGRPPRPRLPWQYGDKIR